MSTTTVPIPPDYPGVAHLELWPVDAPNLAPTYHVAVRPDYDPDDAIVVGRLRRLGRSWAGRLSGERQDWVGGRDAVARLLAGLWAIDQERITARLVAEAEALGAAMSADERRESLHQLGDAFDRGAMRALLDGDVARFDMRVRLGDAAHTEADRG